MALKYNFKTRIDFHFCLQSRYCDRCNIHLCEVCEKKHARYDSTEHYIVPSNMRGITCKCQNHSTEICTKFCKLCDTPICQLCNEHQSHDIQDFLDFIQNKKERMLKDLENLEESIYPKYQEAANNIPVQKDDVKDRTKISTSALHNLKEALHEEIDAIFQRMESEMHDMDAQNLTSLENKEKAINKTIPIITNIIQNLKKLRDPLHNDASFIFKYKSRNEEFRRLPAQFRVIKPFYAPQESIKKQIYQQIERLLKLSKIYHFDEQADIQTVYKGLRNVSCLSDSELWTNGEDKTIGLYNLQGELVKGIETTSGVAPRGIAVTRSGDLVYTDYCYRSINVMSNTKKEPLIILERWIPYSVCSTSSDDLLVTMDSDDNKQSKVVRYSGSVEKQSIQWDDNGKPLYKAGYRDKYVSENRNLDICVADSEAGAVVVVSAVGKFRFRYTGPTYDTERSFCPLGITTDSQGEILTLDYENHNIHIIDQDGHFLRYIDISSLHGPRCICVDSRDNLFVAEYETGKVKKIQF